MHVHNSESTDRRENQETGIITEERLKTPAMYAVVVHNDPFTPRTFVVEVLRRVFQKSEEQAKHIMLTAHTTGHGVVAVYSREVAETKAAQANTYSHEQGMLLIFSIEEV
jgi:ATP-dependent Clp protease adaptor protein ClpS